LRDDEQLSGRDVLCNFVVSSVKCQVHRANVLRTQVRAVRIVTNGSSTRSENILKNPKFSFYDLLPY
jgi:hypothetical protein